FWDELQRDVPPEFQVLGLVDHAHTTAPKLAQDAIVGHGLTDHENTTLPTAVMLGSASDLGQLEARRDRLDAALCPSGSQFQIEFISRSDNGRALLCSRIELDGVNDDYYEPRNPKNQGSSYGARIQNFFSRAAKRHPRPCRGTLPARRRCGGS